LSKLRKILVGLDGSKNSFRALKTAMQFAKPTGASITCISVIQTFPTEMGRKKTMIGKMQSKHVQHFTEIAKAMCAKKDVGFFNVLEFGEEGRKIVSFAQKNNFDLIVIGSRGRGEMKEFFLGSTSNYVAHKSKIPVLIIK
jgi:nucleotide-binding universal stress UspA family protein